MAEQIIPEHEIVTVPSDDRNLRQQCYAVRIDVFHREQKFPLETEIDDMEDRSVHILLRLTPSHTPVGTIRAYKQPGAVYYKLSRLAVLKPYRQYRFGRELVEGLHDWVKLDAIKSGYKDYVTIVTHSQIPVKGFYAKFGYVAGDDEFDEDGDPHQKMVVRLPLTT
ncbi:acyl-CoA N-acyltransferase [Pleurotus eryngii]|uniref:Acyl-CoA N-acyltransferase n=1 Tax=Pleurotus eryngii TaxID=5323 RepID=A0A9P6A268_PLEER|nr:acyl-CoA N-acyltransferase [Pleurotus eryngii]